MEARGMVNVYVCQAPACVFRFATINLNTGVTPFMIGCPRCEVGNAQSSFYRVSLQGKVEVEYAFFRPAVLPRDDAVCGHVVNGGLLFARLDESLARMLRTPDPSREDCSEDEWLRLLYGWWGVKLDHLQRLGYRPRMEWGKP